MNKKYFKWLLLVLFATPIMFLNACTIVFDRKINDGLVSQMNDFTNVTQWITKGLVLSNEKKWDTTNLIRNILETKKDDLSFKNMFSSYFGNLNSDQWSPTHEDFFDNLNHKNDFPFNHHDKYNDLINQNQTFGTIKVIGSFLENLSVDSIKQIINNDSILDKVVTFLRSDQLKDYWNQFSQEGYDITLDSVLENIDEHQNFINQGASYKKVLEWSEKKIKKIIINIQCDQISSIKSCQEFDNDNAKYQAIMEQFVNLDIKSLSAIDFSINETIKNNFQTGFKRIDNIINILVPMIPMITWMIKINETLWPEFHTKKIWNDVPEEVTTEINDKINEKYQGLDVTIIKSLKENLNNIFNIDDFDYKIRKYLVIFRATPALNNLTKHIKVNLGEQEESLIEVLAFNNLTVYDQAVSKLHDFLIPVFNDIKKYLAFMPEEIHVDFNNLLVDFKKLLNVIKRILNNDNFVELQKVLKKDNEAVRNYFLKLIGYADGKIVANKLVDTILTIIKGENDKVTDSLKLIRILTDKTGVIEQLININEKKINTEYKKFYLVDTYWKIFNQEMVFNKNMLELKYKISFKNNDTVNEYSVKWVSKFVVNSSRINFKIMEFNKK